MREPPKKIMRKPLAVDERVVDNVAVISLANDFVTREVPKVTKVVDEFLQGAKIKGLLFNMADVDLVDSYAIGLLMDWYKQCAHLDLKMAVCGLNKNIRSIFHIATLDRIITVFNDMTTAMDCFETIRMPKPRDKRESLN